MDSFPIDLIDMRHHRLELRRIVQRNIDRHQSTAKVP